MATKNIGIKGYDGLPFIDEEVRTGLNQLNAKIIKDDFLQKLSINKENFLKTSGKTAMLTWVDDDSSYNGIPNVKSICDELKIKCTFGVITKTLTESNTLELLKSYQSEGFHITTHTNDHGRWYKETSDGAMFTLEECKQDLILSLKLLQENGFIESNYLIYPGGFSSREGSQEIVKGWVKCAVNPAGNKPNHLIGKGRYNIDRQFILKGEVVSKYTDMIDSAIKNGDWLIFGTHSGIASQWDGDLIKQVFQYAIDRGIKIFTLNEGFARREVMYKINEAFN